MASTVVGATASTNYLLIESLKAVYELVFGSSFNVDEVVYLDEEAQFQCRVSAVRACAANVIGVADLTCVCSLNMRVLT